MNGGDILKKLKSKSLKSRLALYFGALLMVVCIGLGLISFFISKNSLINTVGLTLPEVAVQASSAVENAINGEFSVLERIAVNETILDESIPMSKKLQILEDETVRMGYLSMDIVDADGNIHNLDGSKVNLKDEPNIQKALAGQRYVTDPFISKIDGKLVVIYSVPIVKDSKVIGVLSAVSDGNKLSNFTNKIKFGNTGQAFMLSKDGTTIAHNNKDLVINKDNDFENIKTDPKLASLVEIEKKMVAGESGAGEYSYNGKYKYVGYAPIKSTGWSVAIAIESKEILHQLDTLSIYITVAALIFLVLGSAIVWIFSGSFTKIIKDSLLYIKNIAGGDLTFDVSKKDLQREDELGEMARSIEEMKLSITSMISEIKDSSDNIDAQSENLSAVSQEMASSSEDVSTAIQDVAKGTGEQASDLVDITSILDDFSFKLNEMVNLMKNIDFSTGEIKNMADASNNDMENVIKSVQRVSNAFTDLIGKIEEVGQNITRINEITNLINSISEQTNLLALNAAIEAARAGEAGRGFSVVAEEIRKLAEQSKDSSINIASLISEISKDTEVMVNTTDVMKGELLNQKNNIDTAIKSFETITDAVEGIRPKIHSANASVDVLDKSKDVILEKIESASSISQEVSASSEEIAASSEEMNASTEELAASSQILSNMTKKMMEHVKKFKI